MDNHTQMKSLLNKSYFVIDFLPEQVPQTSQKRFFDIEQYFMSNTEIKNHALKIIRIILKLYCYFHFDIYCRQWFGSIEVKQLTKMIYKTVTSKKGDIYILLADEDCLLHIEGGVLNLTVYNPNTHLQQLLSSLALSENLFWWSADA